LEALPVEDTLNELQQKKAERLARSVGPSEAASTADLPSQAPSVAEGDDKSQKSSQADSFVHASQVVGGSHGSADAASQAPGPRKSKVQLWNELKVDCTYPNNVIQNHR